MNSVFHISRLSYLSLISVTGADAAQFLQGQLTCNINQLTAQQASLAAYCTAKGRVISLVLVVKVPHGFYLLLPSSLKQTVLKRLRMYVLRSAVTLTELDDPNAVCGFKSNESHYLHTPLPAADFAVEQSSAVLIRMPSPLPRYLLLNSDAHHGADMPTADDEWRFDDISAGLPWFDAEQSEQHTPQMLSLEQWGAISFNKGCYTGQEIIARAHYLGKTKRSLLIAQLADGAGHTDVNGLAVLDAETGLACGQVLIAQSYAGKQRLLIVIRDDSAASARLVLDNASHSLIDLQLV